MAKKLTPEQIEALVADYEAWKPYDPDNTTTADDLAARHGVSKQTMYTYINKRKRAGAKERTEQEFQELRQKLAEAQEAVMFLTQELIVARAELAAAQGRNGTHT